MTRKLQEFQENKIAKNTTYKQLKRSKEERQLKYLLFRNGSCNVSNKRYQKTISKHTLKNNKKKLYPTKRGFV